MTGNAVMTKISGLSEGHCMGRAGTGDRLWRKKRYSVFLQVQGGWGQDLGGHKTDDQAFVCEVFQQPKS